MKEEALAFLKAVGGAHACRRATHMGEDRICATCWNHVMESAQSLWAVIGDGVPVNWTDAHAEKQDE